MQSISRSFYSRSSTVQMGGFPQATAQLFEQFFPQHQKVVAIDLETSGLSPITNEIIEIAAVKLHRDGTLSLFETLVCPQKPISTENSAIHGITNQMLKDAPSIEQVLPSFFEFISHYPLVAHNAQFDIGFIITDAITQKITWKKNPVYDSCVLSRRVFKKANPAPQNYKLSSLAEFFSIPLSHHRAMEDTSACLKIFFNMLDIIKENKQGKHMVDVSHIFDLEPESNKSLIKNPLVNTILEALENNIENLQIKYQGGSWPKDKWRQIKPIAVLPLPQGHILYALCHHSKMNKPFKITKITDVRYG